jgi:L-rhamnose mutarotase
MQFYKGIEEGCTKHQDKLWSDLKTLLKSIGIRDYSIVTDEKNNAVFRVMIVCSHEAVGNLPTHPVMKKRRAYITDIMESNNNTQVTLPLVI